VEGKIPFNGKIYLNVYLCRGVINLFVFLIFYLIVLPMTTLLHEIGHGLGVIVSSKAQAKIYLGNPDEKNMENFRLGRLHFHINWSYIGYCYWGSELNKQQRICTLLGGPAMSLLISVACFLFAFVISTGDLHSLLRGTAMLNLFQFIITIIPITYPRWMSGYSRQPSDGMQLLRLIKESPTKNTQFKK